LCENLTFIGYLCEICSMCKNMAIWCLDCVSKVCVVSQAFCSVSDGHYTESGNYSVSGEEKGRRALIMCVSHLKKRETLLLHASLILRKGRRVKTANRKFSTGHLQDRTHVPVWTHAACNPRGVVWSTSYF
jgi:hypothetical protein